VKAEEHVLVTLGVFDHALHLLQHSLHRPVVARVSPCYLAGELAVALDGAGQRSLGDGWAWSRAKSGCDITPLTSLTFAVEFYRGSWGTS
jgi:hypothetical protein